MDHRSDQACIAAFAKRQRLWLKVAVASAAVLLLSVVKTARGEARLDLQLAGLAMLAAFIVASAMLCRCPRCRRFVRDPHMPTPGWTRSSCPHCQARLREPR